MALQKLIENLNQKARPPIETAEKGIPFDTLKTPLPEAFDPDGLLNEVIAFWQGKDNGNESCIEHISQMVADGMLKSPWGFKVKNSPVIGGDYWIVSDTTDGELKPIVEATARERIPSEAMSFTTTELKPIVEACKVFNGKVVEIKKLQTRQVTNGS